MSKTTSKELSIALKEAGAKQESEYVWEPKWYKWETGREMSEEWILGREERFSNLPCWNKKHGERIAVSAFDCHELLERLPEDTRIDKCIGGHYAALPIYRSEDGSKPVHYADTPAKVLGKLYLWCLENGHCEKDGGES